MRHTTRTLTAAERARLEARRVVLVEELAARAARARRERNSLLRAYALIPGFFGAVVVFNLVWGTPSGAAAAAAGMLALGGLGVWIARPVPVSRHALERVEAVLRRDEASEWLFELEAAVAVDVPRDAGEEAEDPGEETIGVFGRERDGSTTYVPRELYERAGCGPWPSAELRFTSVGELGLVEVVASGPPVEPRGRLVLEGPLREHVARLREPQGRSWWFEAEAESALLWCSDLSDGTVFLETDARDLRRAVEAALGGPPARPV